MSGNIFLVWLSVYELEVKIYKSEGLETLVCMIYFIRGRRVSGCDFDKKSRLKTFTAAFFVKQINTASGSLKPLRSYYNLID